MSDHGEDARWEPVPIPQGDGRHDIGDDVRAAIVQRLIDDWSRDPDLTPEKVRQLAMWAGASVRALLHELGTLAALAGAQEPNLVGGCQPSDPSSEAAPLARQVGGTESPAGAAGLREQAALISRLCVALDIDPETIAYDEGTDPVDHFVRLVRLEIASSPSSEGTGEGMNEQCHAWEGCAAQAVCQVFMNDRDVGHFCERHSELRAETYRFRGHRVEVRPITSPSSEGLREPCASCETLRQERAGWEALSVRSMDRAEAAEAQLTGLREQVDEAMRLLSPTCADETLVGAIRNLQQAHLSEKGNAEEAERQLGGLREALEQIVALPFTDPNSLRAIDAIRRIARAALASPEAEQ